LELLKNSKLILFLHVIRNKTTGMGVFKTS
jgi:hypothetical protein